jgi:hypothetical protein
LAEKVHGQVRESETSVLFLLHGVGSRSTRGGSDDPASELSQRGFNFATGWFFAEASESYIFQIHRETHPTTFFVSPPESHNDD